jgi:hypothetical protein
VRQHRHGKDLPALGCGHRAAERHRDPRHDPKKELVPETIMRREISEYLISGDNPFVE